MEEKPVVLSLTQAEALVLFDFVARFEREDSLAIEDQAEKRVLWDLLCMLEEQVDDIVTAEYGERLAKARAAVRDPSFE